MKVTLAHRVGKILSRPALFLTLLLLASPLLQAAGDSESKLDQKIEAGLAALRAKDWKRAQSSFEEAVKIFEGKPSASALVVTKISLPGSPGTTIYVDGKPKDVGEEVKNYRQVMATEQTLYEFTAFASQLAGDDRAAEKYLSKVDEMRGALWGKSWLDLVPRIHALFFSQVSADGGENFGKYLLAAGRLLLAADDPGGIKLFRDAKQLLPKDPAVPAALASYFITHADPSSARAEARASLALNPSQPNVLIDLATAEWLLGELKAATQAAHKAAELSPELPGPYAALAFVALEEGDTPSALQAAEQGVRLSKGHEFYQTILAACLEASGDTGRAQKLMQEAWGGAPPGEEHLKAWFFRGKALEYARKITKQAGRR